MANERFEGLTDMVTTPEALEEIVGAPPQAVLDKVLDRLDDICRDFIANAPFCLIGSRGKDGPLDISPKGDPAGFVTVLDDKHIAIPDRPGNRRVDTFHNVLSDPHVGLLFLIPGKGETLRISGEARIVRDLAVRERMSVNDRVPELAMVIYVERAFMHCPKCVIRSKLWQPEAWPDSDGVADINHAMIRQAKIDATPEELYAFAEREGFLRLY